MPPIGASGTGFSPRTEISPLLAAEQEPVAHTDPLSTGLFPRTEPCDKPTDGKKHDSAEEKLPSGYSPTGGRDAGRSRRRGTRPIVVRGLAGGVVSKEETHDYQCEPKDDQGLTHPFANPHDTPQGGHGLEVQQLPLRVEIDVLYPPPRTRLEESVPDWYRWLTERVERYVTSRRGVGEDWRKQTRRASRNRFLPSGCGARLKPGWFARLEFDAPTRASGVTRERVEALRDTRMLTPC